MLKHYVIHNPAAAFLSLAYLDDQMLIAWKQIVVEHGTVTRGIDCNGFWKPPAHIRSFKIDSLSVKCCSFCCYRSCRGKNEHQLVDERAHWEKRNCSEFKRHHFLELELTGLYFAFFRQNFALKTACGRCLAYVEGSLNTLWAISRIFPFERTGLPRSSVVFCTNSRTNWDEFLIVSEETHSQCLYLRSIFVDY